MFCVFFITLTKMFFKQDKLEDNSNFWRLIRLQVRQRREKDAKYRRRGQTDDDKPPNFPQFPGSVMGVGMIGRFGSVGGPFLWGGRGGMEERGRERESYLPSKYPSFLLWKRTGEGTAHRAFHGQRHSSLLWVGGWLTQNLREGGDLRSIGQKSRWD